MARYTHPLCTELEIETGDAVAAGKGTDADFGRIVELRGGEVLVHWLGSESRSAISIDEIEYFASLAEAEAAWRERQAA